MSKAHGRAIPPDSTMRGRPGAVSIMAMISMPAAVSILAVLLIPGAVPIPAAHIIAADRI